MGWKDAPAATKWQQAPVHPQQPTAAKAPQHNENPLSQALSGIGEGVSGTLDTIASSLTPLPVAKDIAQGHWGSAAARAVNYLTGSNIVPHAPLGQGDDIRAGLTKVGAFAAPSQNTGNQMVRRVGQSVGAAAIPIAGASNSVGTAVKALIPALTGGTGAAIAQQIAPGNHWAELAGEAIGSLFGGGALYGAMKRNADKAAIKAVPTVEDLKKQASSLYDLAEQNGVRASQQQTQDLADQISGIAKQEGLISPTGRVSEAYPKAREALGLTSDYAQGEMSPRQMQTVRKVLSEAAGGNDPSERRIARQMLSAFDNWTAPLSPELAQARAVARRYISAQKLETAKELAGAKASQFSGSGYENALRSQYRELDRKIIKGQENGFTPDAVAAIQDVSRGTPTSNAARYVGKLAPTGTVSAGLSGGIPFMIGNAVGGPALGGTMAAGSLMTGGLSRNLATKMSINKANLAELIARNGGKLPPPLVFTPEVRNAIIAAQAGQYLGVAKVKKHDK